MIFSEKKKNTKWKLIKALDGWLFILTERNTNINENKGKHRIDFQLKINRNRRDQHIVDLRAFSACDAAPFLLFFCVQNVARSFLCSCTEKQIHTAVTTKSSKTNRWITNVCAGVQFLKCEMKRFAQKHTHTFSYVAQCKHFFLFHFSACVFLFCLWHDLNWIILRSKNDKSRINESIKYCPSSNSKHKQSQIESIRS